MVLFLIIVSVGIGRVVVVVGLIFVAGVRSREEK
jgi:hypothetical protein